MSLSAQRHVILASGGSAPTPVLPSHTIRCKFNAGYTPTMGDTQTLVDAQENIWDIYNSSNDWTTLFQDITDLLEVVAANTTGVTNMGGMFRRCTSLTSVPLFDTASVVNMASTFKECSSLAYLPAFTTANVVNMYLMLYGCISLTSVPLFDTANVTNMREMLSGCTHVESGALALYQQASTQATPPSAYVSCFTDCGLNAPASAPIHAEMQQIPSSWGGLGA